MARRRKRSDARAAKAIYGPTWATRLKAALILLLYAAPALVDATDALSRFCSTRPPLRLPSPAATCLAGDVVCLAVSAWAVWNLCCWHPLARRMRRRPPKKGHTPLPAKYQLRAPPTPLMACWRAGARRRTVRLSPLKRAERAKRRGAPTASLTWKARYHLAHALLRLAAIATQFQAAWAESWAARLWATASSRLAACRAALAAALLKRQPWLKRQLRRNHRIKRWLKQRKQRRRRLGRRAAEGHCTPAHALNEQRGGADVDDLREDSPPKDPAVYVGAHVLYEFRVTGGNGIRSRLFEGIVERVSPGGRGWTVYFPEDDTRYNFVWSPKSRSKDRSLYEGLLNAARIGAEWRRAPDTVTERQAGTTQPSLCRRDAADSEVAEQLGALGLRFAAVAGDGDCAFSSVGHGLGHANAAARGARYKSAAVGELRRQAHAYVTSSAGKHLTANYSAVETQALIKPGAWVGCLALRALAISLGRDIVVLNGMVGSARPVTTVFYAGAAWMGPNGCLYDICRDTAALAAWLDGGDALSRGAPRRTAAQPPALFMLYNGVNHYDALERVPPAACAAQQPAAPSGDGEAWTLATGRRCAKPKAPALAPRTAAAAQRASPAAAATTAGAAARPGLVSAKSNSAPPAKSAQRGFFCTVPGCRRQREPPEGLTARGLACHVTRKHEKPQGAQPRAAAAKAKTATHAAAAAAVAAAPRAPPSAPPRRAWRIRSPTAADWAWAAQQSSTGCASGGQRACGAI